MKKPLCTLILFLFFGLTQAQTQKGYVKTLGRPDAKGAALSDVIVKIKGEHNPVKSNDDGVFTIQFQNKKNGDAYALQEVRKAGYELNEPEVVGRQFAVSDKVRTTIVMVSTAQLQADKQRIENNAYNVAEKNYKQKLALLEKEKEDGTITVEKYREQLLELQNRFEKYQSLIDGLAEHYAHTDYDELNDKEGEINICIEDGKLERADSLIQLLFDPIDVLKRNKEALAKLNEQILQAEGIIDQANKDMVAVLKQQEKDAEYLYQLYTIALARFDYEKAGKYIETRAELDTTNIRWQEDAGKYCEEYLAYYQKALAYYMRAIKMSDRNDSHIAYYKSCAARQYDNMGMSEEAILFFYEAICTWIKVYTGEEYKQEEDNDKWLNLHSIGEYGSSVFSSKEDSIPQQIRAKIYGCFKDIEGMFFRLQNDEEYGFQFAMFSHELRVKDNELPDILQKFEETPYGTYIDNEGEDKTNLYYSLYIDYLKQMNGKENLSVADVYFKAAPFAKDSKSYYSKAIDIYIEHYGSIHPKVLRCKSQILFELVNRKKYQEAISYAEAELVADARQLYEDDNQFWESVNWNLGYAYQNIQAYLEAIKCYNSYLRIIEKDKEMDPIYKATIYKRLCQIYLKTGEIQKMRKILKEALDIYVEREDAMDYTDEYHEIYELGVVSGLVPEIMTNITYVIRINDSEENSPAKNQGMKGEYFILEYGDWNIGSSISLFKKNIEIKDKPKDIVVMQDDIISKYHFDNIIGANFDLKFIGQEEKQHVITMYKEWKKE